MLDEHSEYIPHRKLTRSQSLIDLRDIIKYRKYNLPVPILDYIQSNPSNTSNTSNNNTHLLKYQFKNERYNNRKLTENERYEIQRYIQQSGIDIVDIFYLNSGIENEYYIKNSVLTCSDYYTSQINHHILFRYQILKKLGKGTYSSVLKCFDHKKQNKIALKIMRKKIRFSASYIQEVKCLNIIRDNIKTYNKVTHTTSDIITTFYGVFQWKGFNIIKMKLYNQNLYSAKLGKLDMHIVRIIMVDIFEGLNFLKQQGIIHGDLKPENVFFINDSYNVVLGDFGLSLVAEDEYQNMYNIQTRWYRAPEIILNVPYIYYIDMWSAGAIMLELFLGKAMFSSKDEYELFYITEKIVGTEFINKHERYNPKQNTFLKIYNTKKHTYDKGYICERTESLICQINNSKVKEINYLVKNIFLWDAGLRITPYLAIKYLIDTYN